GIQDLRLDTQIGAAIGATPERIPHETSLETIVARRIASIGSMPINNASLVVLSEPIAQVGVPKYLRCRKAPAIRTPCLVVKALEIGREYLPVRLDEQVRNI